MPRLARLDAAGALHHVMIRGIERRKIFRDNKDRDDLLERLSTILPEQHIMLRMGIHVKPRPLSLQER